MRKVPFTGLCCVLLSFCLVSCGKNTSTKAIQMDLVDSFFKAKEDVVSVLNLKDSNLKSTKDLLEEYSTSVLWCGNNLSTAIFFYDGEPVTLSATAELSKSEECVQKINDELTLFEAQFETKSIDVVGESENSGKTVDYNRDIISEELERIMTSFGLVRFKFTVPYKDNSKVLVEYTCRRIPDNPEVVTIEYSIRNYFPIQK